MRISDWSSDVCSSDLQFGAIGALDCLHLETKHPIAAIDIHKSSISDKLRPQLLKKLGRGDSWVLGDDRSSQRYGALLERPNIAAVSMFGECFAAKGPVSNPTVSERCQFNFFGQGADKSYRRAGQFMAPRGRAPRER